MMRIYWDRDVDFAVPFLFSGLFPAQTAKAPNAKALGQ